MVRMVASTTATPAPKHLSERSKRIWRAVVSDYDLRELHHLTVLRLGLEAVDRAELARLQIAKDGLFLPDRYGGVKAHPAEKTARDSTVIAARCFRELALSEDYVDEPRLPRVDGARS
jgi:hypothetical protein